MKLLISQRGTDIFKADDFRTIFIKKDNTMILGLSNSDRTMPVGEYQSEEEAREAIRIMTHRLSGNYDVVHVPSEDEVKKKTSIRQGRAMGRKQSVEVAHEL